MAEDPKAPKALATFRSGHELALERDEVSEALLIRAQDGSCVLRIVMSEAGPVVQLSAATLEVVAASTLSLRAERLEVHAGSAVIDVENDLALRAQRGGMSLEANDDVDIRGERVRLNSPELPMPLTWEQFREREQRTTLPSDDDE
jgi:plasmid stability protein